jgi:hypothetical protein
VSKLIKPARAAECYEQGPSYRPSYFGQIIWNGSTVRRKLGESKVFSSPSKICDHTDGRGCWLDEWFANAIHYGLQSA